MVFYLHWIYLFGLKSILESEQTEDGINESDVRTDVGASERVSISLTDSVCAIERETDGSRGAVCVRAVKVHVYWTPAAATSEELCKRRVTHAA